MSWRTASPGLWSGRRWCSAARSWTAAPGLSLRTWRATPATTTGRPSAPTRTTSWTAPPRTSQ
eukprot:scaffold649610_cov47-Prasinocladus_malaysianus.AAC.1